MLKYDEMTNKHQKAEITKLHLIQELDAQKAQNIKIEEACHKSQQEETNLKAQMLTIQNELNTLRAKPCSEDSSLSELQRENKILRQELRKAERDLLMELNEFGRARNELEHQAAEISTIKVWILGLSLNMTNMEI